MKPLAVLFDIDGTLLNLDGLEDWMDGTRTDYDEFHLRAVDAKPIEEVVRVAQDCWWARLTVLIVTAREDSHRETTMAWLTKQGIAFDLLGMRSPGDTRPDLEVKSEMFLQLMKVYNIISALEDNPQIVDWLRSNAIPTIKIGDR